MAVVFAVALLVLAAAVVVLFAMLGELASRIPDGGPATVSFRDVEGARLGHRPVAWSADLPAPDLTRPTVLLVLSPVCSSCADIAEQLPDDPAELGWPELGVVVSAGAVRNGEDFVARRGIGRYPHLIDEGGQWVGEEFGVRLSPTALVFTGGVLTAALLFNDIPALRARVSPAQPDRQQPERESV